MIQVDQTRFENELEIYSEVIFVESIQVKKSEKNHTTSQAKIIFLEVDRLSHLSLITSINCNNCLLNFLVFALSLYSIYKIKK